jgi:homocitrate synthase NifV
LRKDVEAALDADMDIVHVGLPVSNVQMNALGMCPKDVLHRMRGLVRMITQSGRRAFVGAQDATRGDAGFLNRFVFEAVLCGAARVRLADTVGVGDPFAVHELVTRLKNGFPGLELEFHAHNDFGMAVANATAALRAGADFVSTTVGGIGERAGNASMECVVMAVEQMWGISCGIDVAKLPALCRAVSHASGRSISPSQPIVGEMVFAHESGVHTHGQLYDPRCFQPILATKVGRTDSLFVYGKHTGKSAVRHLLEHAGISFSKDIIDSITQEIRSISVAQKCSFSEQEIVEWIKCDVMRRSMLVAE